MARIMFIMDVEEGHILPSFGLSSVLKDKGHSVVYLSIPDNEALVTEQGFEFYPIFQKTYPKGYRQEYKKRRRELVHSTDKKSYLNEIMEGAYDAYLKTIRADLFVISNFLRFDILIMYYHFHISPVIFTPYLKDPGVTTAIDCMGDLLKIPPDESLRLIEFFTRSGAQFKSLEQLVSPMNTLPELVACPYELEIEGGPVPKNIHYIGPSIRKGSGAEQLALLAHRSQNRRVIYCSLGSQAISYPGACASFYQKIIGIMRHESMQDYHLMLAADIKHAQACPSGVPSNVTIEKWLPQVDILKIASLAVIHGGMGTVKECIYYGVPMLIFPLDRDQPSNGRRVVHHGLGVMDQIEKVTEDQLLSQILYVLKSKDIRTNIDRMQTIFQAKEASSPGAGIIERLLVPSTI